MPFKASSVSPIETGEHTLQLLGFEDVDGSFGPQIKWAFHVWDASGEQVLDGNGDAYEYYQYTSQATGLKSKARPWIEAFLGSPLPEHPSVEELEAITANLVGRTARAFLAVNDRGYPEVRDMRARRAVAAPPPTDEAPPATPFWD